MTATLGILLPILDMCTLAHTLKHIDDIFGSINLMHSRNARARMS